MAKMLLWICIGVGGTIGAVLPGLWQSHDLLLATLLSTLGSIAGIWFWVRYLRFS